MTRYDVFGFPVVPAEVDRDALLVLLDYVERLAPAGDKPFLEAVAKKIEELPPAASAHQRQAIWDTLARGYGRCGFRAAIETQRKIEDDDRYSLAVRTQAAARLQSVIEFLGESDFTPDPSTPANDHR